MYPAGKPSTSPRFPHGFIREFQGFIPEEISSLYPCGNSGEIKDNFLCTFFPLFSLENHRVYFQMEISLVFPSKCQSVIKGHSNGPSCEKNIPVMFWCQFFGELKDFQVRGNYPLISTWNFGRNLGDVSAWKFFNGFSTSLRQIIHVDKTTCLSSSKFHRG